MNLNAIKELREIIVKEGEERFDMSTWGYLNSVSDREAVREGREPNICKTSACLAGSWVRAKHPEEFKQTVKMITIPSYHYDPLAVEIIARKDLGLGFAEADALFTPCISSHGVTSEDINFVEAVAALDKIIALGRMPAFTDLWNHCENFDEEFGQG